LIHDALRAKHAAGDTRTGTRRGLSAPSRWRRASASCSKRAAPSKGDRAGGEGQRRFGYDPIFFYPPFGQTLAEAGDRKAAVSHRGEAFRALAAFPEQSRFLNAAIPSVGRRPRRAAKSFEKTRGRVAAGLPCTLHHAPCTLHLYDPLSGSPLRPPNRLARSRTFSAIAVTTLALGIGANTALFTIVHAILLAPLPFRSPEQLVRVTADFQRQA
jgi:hypothetical protein